MSARTKQVLQAVVGLGLAAALLIWGLPYFAKTSWPEIWAQMRSVPLGHIIGFQVLMLAGLWCYTFTFTGALRGLSHSKALIINLCGSSVSNLLPGGGAVGLAATYAMCRSWGFTRRATSTSAIVTGVWNVLARIALPVVAILSLWFGGVTLPVDPHRARGGRGTHGPGDPRGVRRDHGERARRPGHRPQRSTGCSARSCASAAARRAGRR